jgi:hypothetical protein
MRHDGLPSTPYSDLHTHNRGTPHQPFGLGPMAPSAQRSSRSTALQELSVESVAILSCEYCGVRATRSRSARSTALESVRHLGSRSDPQSGRFPMTGVHAEARCDRRQNPAGAPSARGSVAEANPPGTTSIGAEVPTVTPGGGITYVALTDTYLYEWKTSKGWTGCRRLIVTLADGTRHHADFQFK